MSKPKKARPLYQRIAIDIAGFSLIIISLLIGWLPGPAGIPLLLAGLGLVSINHEWASRLLEDFENKRQHITDKYLMASSKVSILIDIFCLVVLCSAVYLATTLDNIILRTLSLTLVGTMVVTILSNQKRFERILKFFKK